MVSCSILRETESIYTMARYIINRINLALYRVEETVGYILGSRFPPGALCSVHVDNYEPTNLQNSDTFQSLKDIITEGFLFAAPKHRRSIEKRWSRRFGWPDGVWKPLVPKTNLLACTRCGNHHEAGLLCHHCYHKVKAETTEMQETIIKTLGLEPVEKNVVVLYEGEKENKSAEYWKGQRIIELPKQRPAWFHSNLLQPTTQEPSESTDVKPTGLA